LEHKAVKEEQDSYSTREKNLWFELLVDLAVGLYYWPNAMRLMLAGDEALRGGPMAALLLNTMVAAVFFGIALTVFLHRQEKPEPMDERDHMIMARSGLIAGRALIGSVIAVIGLVVIQELPGPYTSHLTFLALTPLVIAHLLLVALMVWSFTSVIARLYYYRRGY
jgi:hypothetical protein